MHIGSWNVHDRSGRQVGTISVTEASPNGDLIVTRHDEQDPEVLALMGIGPTGSVICQATIRGLANSRRLCPIPPRV